MIQPKCQSTSRVARFLPLTAAALLVASALFAGLAKDARAESFVCTPTESAVFTGNLGSRLHIRCQQPYPNTNIVWFAFRTGNSRVTVGGDMEFVPNDNADRILNLATAAVVNNKNLAIWFDLADVSGVAIGCLAADCRLIKAVALIK